MTDQSKLLWLSKPVLALILDTGHLGSGFLLENSLSFFEKSIGTAHPPSIIEIYRLKISELQYIPPSLSF